MTMTNAEYLAHERFTAELEKLEAARKAKGLTYEALAEQVGVSKVWMASMGTGGILRQDCRRLRGIRC